MRATRRFSPWMIILLFFTSLVFNIFLIIRDQCDSSPAYTSIILQHHNAAYDDSGGNVVVVEDPAELVERTNAKLEAASKKLQKLRKNVLREACTEFNELPSRNHNLNSTSLNLLKHTYVFDKHRLLYCYVPKVGCTSWKQLFLVSYGIIGINERKKSVHKEFSSAFKTAGQLTEREANQKLKDYKHFLFVRNPFSRLLSAYREKIEGKNPEDTAKSFLSKMITRWLKQTNPKYLARRKKTQPYSFLEFVRYVIARKEENEHWNGQYELCHPCLVEYDFIGKYETLQDDARDFLRSATSDSSLRFPETDPIKLTRNSSSDENMVKYYHTMPDAVFISLIDCFYRDLRLFGYSIPHAIRRPKLRLSKKYLKLKEVG